jgi:hypothetical protein
VWLNKQFEDMLRSNAVSIIQKVVLHYTPWPTSGATLSRELEVDCHNYQIALNRHTGLN